MSDTVRRRLRVWISGRVQGVGFRAYTQAQARSLELAGWVRNLPDRRVEALFDGAAEPVEAMLRWCWQGSPFSKVEAVESREQEPGNDPMSGYEIRY